MPCCCITPAFAEDPDNYDNFNQIGFAPTANAPEITFRVRASSHGNIRIYVAADADALNEELKADVEIRDDDSAGTIRHSPNVTTGGIAYIFDPDFPQNLTFYGDRPLEPLGLAPGIYWAQLQISTDGTNMDIAHQWIRFGA